VLIKRLRLNLFLRKNPPNERCEFLDSFGKELSFEKLAPLVFDDPFSREKIFLEDPGITCRYEEIFSFPNWLLIV